MDKLTEILNWGPVSRVRRNHALEHATLQLLTHRHAPGAPAVRLAGYSDAKGFWVFGRVETDVLLTAAEQARQRLVSGESGLAVHPTCGTNYVVSGIVAGGLAWLGTLFGSRGFRARVERLPVIVLLVTLGLIAAAPLGPLVQSAVTTQAQLGALEIAGVLRHPRQDIVVHRVLTRG